MKILCYSTSHDSNFTYYDTEEGKIRYYSIERMWNLKHAECRLNYFLIYAHHHFGFDENKDIIIRTLMTETAIDCFSNLKENELYHFDSKNKIVLDHHYAHILSSYALNTKCKNGIAIDGRGNFNRSTVIFRNIDNIDKTTFYIPTLEYNNIKTQNLRIGFLFSLLSRLILKEDQKPTYECGLQNDMVGKLMGLQSYGKIDKTIYRNCLNIGISNLKGLRLYFQELFNDFDPQNKQSNFDAVYTCHQFLVDQIKRIFKREFTKEEEIAYCGGCALSTVTNTQLINEGYKLNICPAANDGGLSLGLLKFADMYFNLNIDFSNLVYCSNTIEDFEYVDDSKINFIANELAKGKIIAYTEGPCEVGPRALGHRSILMNPSIDNGKDYINEKVKHREWWRPFGGSCISTEMFENYTPSNVDYYMLRNFQIKPEWRQKLNAICHIDNSTRMQILTNKNENLYKIIESFNKITGIPAILNTSFNIGGKPIANYKSHIFEAFKEMENIDYLIYNGKIYIRNIYNKSVVIEELINYESI